MAGFHVMAKPTGAICNLDCRYCFFLSKQMLYPGSKFRMSDEVLEQYVRQLLDAHAGQDVTIAWQGGEPTLIGLDFFARAVALVAKHARPRQRVLHTLQTNGVLVDDDWALFFARHDFLVGISIDGPRLLHDAFRVDKQGRPTFDRVMRGLGALRAAGVEWNALVSLHAANAPYPLEVYRFLRDDVGARFIQFIPIVERVMGAGGDEAGTPAGTVRTGRESERPFYWQRGGEVAAGSITAEAYGRFLIAVFDEWVRRDVGRVFVQMFDGALAAWYGAPPAVCVFAPTCGTALALEHTGDLYACDHYVEPAHRLGNILETPLRALVESPRQRRFGRAKADLPAKCRSCDVRFACHGGCPKDRLLATRRGDAPVNYLCAGYKAFFRHVDRPMRAMCERLRRGEAPAAIMRR